MPTHCASSARRRSSTPDNARYAYVYAVALNDAGKTKEALQRARRRTRRRIRTIAISSSASRTISAAAGQRDAAVGYAKTLAELDPENPEYAQLAASLGAAETLTRYVAGGRRSLS